MPPRAGWVKDALFAHRRRRLVLDASEHGGILVCGGVNGNRINPLEIQRSRI
jgi:hypothetical protein